MKAQVKARRFLVPIICLGVAILWPDWAYSKTLEEYVKDCSDGIPEANQIPEVLQCAEGDILPIKNHGEEIPAKTEEDGKYFNEFTTCDSPPLLPLDFSKIGQCVPNSTLRVTTAGAKTYYALLCRNYIYRSADSQRKEPEYDDVAMVVYNSTNKKTCFFQKYGSAKTLGDPQNASAVAPVAAISGTVPSPFSEKGKTFWEMNKMVEIRCSQCHDANPFVRTPYVEQVMKDGANRLPSRTYRMAYDIVDIDDFLEWKSTNAYLVKSGSRNPDEPNLAKPCLRCHSLGRGRTSGDFTDYSGGGLAPGQNRSLDFRLTHWMPPEADKDTWEAEYAKAVKAILACSDRGARCQWHALYDRPANGGPD
jgi:hypothetical protein